MALQPQEMRQQLKGIIALLPTHFHDDESLDRGAIRETAEYARDLLEPVGGCIMIAGSTSEFYAMTDQESLELIRIVVDAVGGKVPVIAGTGRAATKLTIEISRQAEDAGIDCAMITNPYYMQVTDEGLYRHFSLVAQALNIGVMVYNNPTTSKMWVPVAVMKRLSRIPNVIASKENTTTLENYYWMQAEIDPQDFAVCCGIGHLYYMFEAPVGCPAFVTELACVAPHICLALAQAAKDKDYQEVKRQIDALIPYHKFIGQCVARRNVPTVLSQEIGGRATSVYQSILKQAMELRGLPGGIVREPLENITSEERDALRAVLQEIGSLQ